MKNKKFTVEKKLFAQVRFFEELHVIRDERGETIFVGSEETAAKIIKALSPKNPKRKARK